MAALEIRGERMVESTTVAQVDQSERIWLASAGIWFLRETLDRTDFPRRGGRLHVRSEFGVSSVTEGGAFSHHLLDLERRVPLHTRVSAVVGVYLGYADGRDVPRHRRFFLGGDHPSPVHGSTQLTFAGLPTQFLEGTAVQLLRGGIQIEPVDERFVRAWVDAGGVRERWRIDPDLWKVGWGISLGSASLAGPLSLTLTGGAGEARWSFNVGRRF
jgi:outer membrane translocation and assembly module TamA